MQVFLGPELENFWIRGLVLKSVPRVFLKPRFHSFRQTSSLDVAIFTFGSLFNEVQEFKSNLSIFSFAISFCSSQLRNSLLSEFCKDSFFYFSPAFQKSFTVYLEFQLAI